MKDFRIEKCLEDGMDTYEYAIFSDGSRKKRIHVLQCMENILKLIMN